MKIKIFTGNFANAKKYQALGYTGVSIARFNKYWNGASYIDLAPDAGLIHEPEPVYTPRFNAKLARMNKEKVINDLRVLSKGSPVVLLCYEKAGEFCHRRLVADWLSPIIGDIEELGNLNNTQKSLF